MPFRKLVSLILTIALSPSLPTLLAQTTDAAVCEGALKDGSSKVVKDALPVCRRAYQSQAAQGVVAAQSNLCTALAYANEAGGETLDLCRKAADKGDVTSERVLGQLYAEGRSGVGKDMEKALKLLEQAANHGNRSLYTGDHVAQISLGLLLWEGDLAENPRMPGLIVTWDKTATETDDHKWKRRTRGASYVRFARDHTDDPTIEALAKTVLESFDSVDDSRSAKNSNSSGSDTVAAGIVASGLALLFLAGQGKSSSDSSSSDIHAPSQTCHIEIEEYWEPGQPGTTNHGSTRTRQKNVCVSNPR